MKRLCPYWDALRQNCLMTNAGIYIPLPDHIAMYCTTKEFVACKHYRRGCELFREKAEERGIFFNDGRRRYPRMPSRVSVSLAACTENGQMGELLDKEARTLDMSIGGMRVTTNRQLPENQMITFTFGSDFSSPSFKGLGQIRWAGKTDDHDAVQAGVAFLEYKTSQAVGEHLGLAL